MRAGKLDRTIVIHRSTSAEPDEYGTPSEVSTEIAVVRAQLIQASTEEFLRGYGEASETAMVFRIRHLDGITTADFLTYQGRPFDVKEIKELGRREGLDLRCVAKGA